MPQLAWWLWSGVLIGWACLWLFSRIHPVSSGARLVNEMDRAHHCSILYSSKSSTNSCCPGKALLYCITIILVVMWGGSLEASIWYCLLLLYWPRSQSEGYTNCQVYQSQFRGRGNKQWVWKWTRRTQHKPGRDSPKHWIHQSLNVWIFPLPWCIITHVSGRKSLRGRTRKITTRVYLSWCCRVLPSRDPATSSVNEFFIWKLAQVQNWARNHSAYPSVLYPSLLLLI